MKIRNRKTILIFIIIIIVSVSFLISKFDDVAADSPLLPTANTNHTVPAPPDESVVNPFSGTDNGSVVMSITKLIGALLLVVIGIYGFIFVLKRMMGQKLSGNRKNNLIEVLETSYIAQKKSVSLIRFVDRTVLVGVSDGGINVLAELTTEETNKITSGFAQERPVTGFKNILKDAGAKLTGFSMKGIKGIQISEKTKRPQTI
jgi:flagellar biosynthetic protein FliO